MKYVYKDHQLNILVPAAIHKIVCDKGEEITIEKKGYLGNEPCWYLTKYTINLYEQIINPWRKK